VLPSFAFADSFLGRVQSLPNEAKKLVLRKTAEFAATPDAPGFNAEMLSGVARQNGWRSARVDRDLRLIWTRIEDTIVFAWVDRHDDAYAWADRNRLRVNPRTGSAQRYVAPEIVAALPERTGAVASVAGSEASTDQPAQAPPFSGEDDEYLLGLGVPEEWVGQIKSLPAAADLDGLIGLLPDEAWERLVDLANGRRPNVGANASLPDVGDPLKHPDSKRHFMLLSDDAALDQVLSGDWDAWQVFLHPSQRAAVETRHRGPSLVSGAAGTGKSVVAVHRAAFLARRHPEARILLTSYSKTLSVRLAQQLDRLLRGDGTARGRIEVAHLDRRLMDFARLRLGPVNIASRTHIQPLLDRAAREAKLESKDPGFLWAEWETVIDAWGIDSEDAYLRAQREGRGLALPPSARSRVWPVFSTTIAGLARQKMRTWSSVARAVGELLQSRSDRPYSHIVADEAQDLSPAQLLFLRSLVAPGDDDITLGADIGQRIYRRPFSWLAAGIDVRGRACRLRVSYRSTQQILRLADRVVLPPVAEGQEDLLRDAVAVRAGPKPRLVPCASVTEEAEAAGKWIRACLDDGIPAAQIAIFARTSTMVERVGAKAARLAGTKWAELKDEREPEGDTIMLGTIHAAKGLEFRAVAIIGCGHNQIPLPSVLTATTSARDVALAEASERQLLYVALTRARDLLLVTWTGEPSSYLEQEWLSDSTSPRAS
jgi:hypothetical protein